MKKKEFVQTKIQYLGALANGKTKKAEKLRKSMFEAIFERKAEGKKLGRFNFH